MDLLLLFEAPEAGLNLALCTSTLLSREALRRHALASGSGAVLSQALTAALLLAATESEAPARVDLQLECNGPLRGLLVDADTSGAVRGLVRVNDLDRAGARVAAAAEASSRDEDEDGAPLSRFDARPLLARASDEEAGMLSVLRARPGSDALHRAALPFAGADLGAALTLFLRNDRDRGGELALEVLYTAAEPLAAAAGALLWTASDDPEPARALGKTLRQQALRQALRAAHGANAHALARELAAALSLGPLRLSSEARPRFACRCTRDRFVRALGTLGAAELEDMAARDGGAEATCDFCMETYRIGADELRALATRPAQRS